MRAIVTIGVSSSGKTTWAEEFVAERIEKGERWSIVCRDDIRRRHLESRLSRSLNPGELWKLWKFKEESAITAEVFSRLADISLKGGNVIIADTNLNKEHRHSLVGALEKYGFTVEYKNFEVSFEDAMKRDRFRADTVGPEVLWRQYKQWFAEYGMFPKYKADHTLPSCIMFDIDGTLATMNGNRGPFEWDKVTMDEQRTEIVEMAHAFQNRGYKIVVMSGRDSAARQGTLSWLADTDIAYNALFMRKADDMRKDWIVKGELFYEHVAPKYNVMMVVDDRPQVCEFWWLIGLPVAQVGEPHVRF